MYYSQDKQDEYINNSFFKNKKNGFFLEIGANDGIKLSNSFFFEKELFWKGICIEPMPDAFKKLQENRKSENINCCIGVEDTEKEFLMIEGYSEMLSGVIDKYDILHLKRIEQELEIHGGSSKIVLVPLRNINSILEERKITKIDYCSIDTEGGELEIVKSINFKKLKILVFSIENIYEKEELRNYLKSKNYKLVKTLGGDDIFILRNIFFRFKKIFPINILIRIVRVLNLIK